MVLLGIGALAAAAVVLQGQRLGSLVTDNVGAIGLAGRIKVGAIHWRPRLLLDLLTDEPTPLTLTDVAIDDPDGTRVLTLSRLELKVPLRRAIAAKVQLYDVVVGPGSYWRFGDTKDGRKIGFLAALMPKPRQVAAPPPSPAAPDESKFLLQLVNVKIDGLTANFDFPGAWGLLLKDVQGQASVIIDGDFVGWDATKLHAHQGSYLRILDNETLPFDDVRVARVATTREWPNDIFLEVEAGRTGQSVLTGKGFFTHIYDDGPPGIDLHAEFANAGDALAAVAAGHKIEGLRITGPDARVVLDLTQPFSQIAIAGTVSDLNVGYQGGMAQRLGLKLDFSGAEPMTVAVRDLAFDVPEGGSVAMAARLAGTQATADIKFKNVNDVAFVPPEMLPVASGVIDGKIKASFNLSETAGAVTFDALSLRRQFKGGLPQRIQLDGRVSGSPARIDAHALRVTVPGASAQLRGRVDIAKKVLGLSVAAVAQDLPTALGFLTPPAQTPESAKLDIDVSGRFDNPALRGRLSAQSVDIADAAHLPQVAARFALKDGLATLEALEGEIFGGEIAIDGKAQLYRRSFENMLKVPLVELQAQGRSLDLAQLAAVPGLAGRLSFSAWARGPTNRLEGQLTLPPNTELHLLGEAWRIDGFKVEVTPTDLFLRSTRVARARGGGTLQLEGRLSLERGQAMHWSIVVRDLPLSDLPGVSAGSMPPLSGALDADLTVAGSPTRPELAGQLRVSEAVFDGRRLGNAIIDFIGNPEGGTKVTGRLFDRFDLTAEVRLPNRGPEVDAELSFANVSLQGLAPDVAERIGFNGAATGRVNVALRPRLPLAIDVRLDELNLVSRPRNDLLGGGPPLRVQNDGPLIARVRGDVVELDNTRLQTSGGVLELGGRLKGDQLDQVVVRGQLDLALIAPALAPLVQRSEGNLTLALRATGPVARPRVEGSLIVTRQIEISLAALDVPVSVPSGRVRISPKDVELHNLVFQVGQSRLLLQGRASFDKDYQITRYGIGVDGSIDAKILPLLVPRSVTEAEGTIELRGRVGGTPAKPDFDAKVLVHDVSLRLRDLGHSLRLKDGTFTVTPQEARIDKLVATIDEQGQVTIGGPGQEPGRVVFQQLFPEPKIKYVRLPVRGERLVYRVPGVFALDDLGFALDLEGDLQSQMTLRGDVRVVTGRFTQDVAIRDMAISSRLQGESYGRPEPNPLIDDMRLDLRVRTIGDTFLIQNNLSPEMYAVVDLHVGGTAAQPQLDGSILPTDGRFKIPGTGVRGYFDLVPNVNSIVFVGTKILGETTPELTMEAESIVTDVDGQEHNVRMRIRGPINQAEISFSTSDTGLNQNETLLLLLTGRASTSSVRFGTTSGNIGRNLDTGFQMAGNVTRDLVDNLLQPYISDTLSLITGDKLQLRPTVGPDGVEVRVFGRAGRYLRLQLNYLQGFQGQRQARSEGRLWLADFFLLRTFAEYLELPQQGITETSQSLNLELFVEWPIRFDLP